VGCPIIVARFPCSQPAILRPQWQFSIKRDDGTPRSRNCCDGSPSAAPVLHGISCGKYVGCEIACIQALMSRFNPMVPLFFHKMPPLSSLHAHDDSLPLSLTPNLLAYLLERSFDSGTGLRRERSSVGHSGSSSELDMPVEPIPFTILSVFYFYAYFTLNTDFNACGNNFFQCRPSIAQLGRISTANPLIQLTRN
jgi:hypothetical protein